MADKPPVLHTPPQPFPFLLRKLGNRKEWDEVSDPDQPNAPQIASRVFEPPGSGTSVYLVHDLDQLHRALLALDSERHLTTVDYVSFAPTDIQACGIQIEVTAGDVVCRQMRQLHRDLIAASQDQYHRLVELTRGAGHDSRRVTKGEMRLAQSRAVDVNCHAARDTTQPCRVTDCPPGL